MILLIGHVKEYITMLNFDFLGKMQSMVAFRL